MLLVAKMIMINLYVVYLLLFFSLSVLGAIFYFLFKNLKDDDDPKASALSFANFFSLKAN